MSLQYAYGTIGSLALVGVIWLVLFWKNRRMGKYYFGGLLIAFGFFCFSDRSYQAFIIEHRIASDRIMLLTYLGVGACLAGSVLLVLPYLRRRGE